MFDQRGIIIPSPGEAERKLRSFRVENTRVVTDFDHTMSHPGGPTSWALLRQMQILPPAYHERATAYKDTYQPYENDQTITDEQRHLLMHEWWGLHLGLFKEYGLRKEHIDTIDGTQIDLREGIQEAFSRYNALSIPSLILSAGVAQSIEKALVAHGLSGPNISLTANRILFDEHGNYVGINPPNFIHVASKDECHTPAEVQATFRDRTNIILLGDNLQDIKMIRPEERDTTFAIGFCQSNTHEILSAYCKVFDAVVTSPKSDNGILEYIQKRIEST